MNRIFLTLSILATGLSSPSLAAAKDVYIGKDTAVYLLVALCLLAIIFMVVLTISIKLGNILSAKLAERSDSTLPIKTTWWQLFLREETRDLKLDAPMAGHTYDGIQEMDNNPPAWFNWLFFGGIVWGIGYVLYYHVFALAPLSEGEYRADMAQYEVLMAAVEEKRATDVESLVPLTEVADLESGQAIFVQSCSSCHGQLGEGGVGPNLTDEYWIHGGDFKDIYLTIYNGVDGKGMAAWKKLLSYEDIVKVASHVETLKGTTPPNPKEPQGEKYSPGS